MSEKSCVPVYLTMVTLSKYCDLSDYAISLSFYTMTRRQIFRSIDRLHMHTIFFILNIFIKYVSTFVVHFRQTNVFKLNYHARRPDKL